MITHEAFVYEIVPTSEQEGLLRQHCGLARYAFNWALGKWNDHWQRNRDLPKEEREKRPSAYDLSKLWTATKHERLGEDGKPWTDALIRNTVTYAIGAADDAFKHFWRRLRERSGAAYGHPRFKAKGKCADTFTIQDQSFRAEQHAIKLGKLGMIATKEAVLDKPKGRTLTGKTLRIVVARRADRWYASIMVERTRPDPTPVSGPVVGVDLGINHRVTTSEGLALEISDRLERRLRQLGHLMRLLDLKPIPGRRHHGPGARYGSKNRWKLRMRIARVHREIADVRRDQIHKLSHRLATTSSLIVIEGFNIANLVEKRRKKIRGYDPRRTRRRIHDAAWGELRRQLAYKTVWYGSNLHVTDPQAPTARQCHICGHINAADPDNAPPTSVYRCGGCDQVTTRQINTALLQRKVGESLAS